MAQSSRRKWTLFTTFALTQDIENSTGKEQKVEDGSQRGRRLL